MSNVRQILGIRDNGGTRVILTVPSRNPGLYEYPGSDSGVAAEKSLALPDGLVTYFGGL